MPKTVYLIDGSSYIYRAYHALTPLANSKGLPTHAIYGVTNMLLKILREKQPRYLAFVWDSKGPTFRHKAALEYKANRPAMPEDLSQQIPYIKKVIQALGIPSLQAEGYEADDVIATVCKQLPEGCKVVIVSADKDLRQLLDDRIVMWDSMRDKLYTAKDITERLGWPPSRLKEIMALTGDKIDNIPGVPGIGEKTAVRLLKQFGSLDKLLNHIDEVKPLKIRENLIKFKDQVKQNLFLVSLNGQVPIKISLKDLSLKSMDKQRLKSLFEELEFKRLLKEFDLYEEIPEGQLEIVTSIQELERLKDKLKKAERLAIIVKAEPYPSHISPKIIGIALAIDNQKAYYLPLGHFYLGVPPQLSLQEAVSFLKPFLESPQIPKVGHDLKHQLMAFKQYNVSLKPPFFDTLIAYHIFNPSQTEVGLWQLAQDLLKLKTRFVGKSKGHLESQPIETLGQEAAEEVRIVWESSGLLEANLREKGQLPLFEEIEMPLVPVLADMESWGVKLDIDYLKRLSQELTSRLRNLEKRIFALAEEEFNINSPKALRHILFEKLNLPPLKKTKGKSGYSTDVRVLKELALIHPLPQEILNYRALMKLKTTYVDALPQMVNPKTGRLHTNYNQVGTVTGRLSSSNPNLQNIPAKSLEGLAIRQAFIPESGWYFLAADYSQIELRLLAHFSLDEGLITAFKEGQDIHAQTASKIFNVPLEEVTPEMRRQAKVINFGIIYGMSPYGLSQELSIDMKTAQRFIENYFNRYPGVKSYIERALKQAREQGYVTTLFGYRRYLPEINSSNCLLRQAAERIAINTTIQGTAAEIIKKAMIKLWQFIKEKGLSSKMIMQVHDELIFEVPPKELNLMERQVKVVMENVVFLKVPLLVNIKTGKNWAEVT